LKNWKRSGTSKRKNTIQSIDLEVRVNTIVDRRRVEKKILLKERKKVRTYKGRGSKDEVRSSEGPAAVNNSTLERLQDRRGAHF